MMLPSTSEYLYEDNNGAYKNKFAKILISGMDHDKSAFEIRNNSGLDTNLYELRKSRLSSWINKFMKIEMTDGRILIGSFVCTDKDANVILSTCSEQFNTKKTGISEEPRILGLVMIPGRHIVSIQIEKSNIQSAVNFVEC